MAGNGAEVKAMRCARRSQMRALRVARVFCAARETPANAGHSAAQGVHRKGTGRAQAVHRLRTVALRLGVGGACEHARTLRLFLADPTMHIQNI